MSCDTLAPSFLRSARFCRPYRAADADVSDLLLEGAAAVSEDGYLYVGEELTGSDVAALFAGDVTVSGAGRNGYVGTGATVTAGGRTVELVVRGDLNGDGCRTVADYLLLKRAVLGISAPEGAFYQAACISGGTAPKPSDYLKMKREFLFPVKKQDYNGTKLAYIPLDDRPVNVDRVLYLAQSGGFVVDARRRPLFHQARRNGEPTATGPRSATPRG